MAIDTKSIQVFLLKALNITIEACYNIVQAYPKTSLGSVTVFFLYLFLPLVLLLLICSLVVSAIAVVVYRVYFRDDLEGFEIIRGYKKTDDKTPTIVRENDMGKNVIVLGQSDTTRRRNVNEKDKESYVQRSVEDKDVVRPAGKKDMFDKTAVVEENLKEIREVNTCPGDKKEATLVHQASQIVASPPFTSGGHEAATHFSGVKGEEGESSDDSEEEDGREDRNKAVEWSVDDQMNLSHVGNIEIERNTRLENLIARRKARKLLDIHVRNILMRPATNDSRDHIPSIVTARKNHFLTSNSELSPIPGSAPSVLLPMHKSPFDISFDPEEKSIPTGDSFKKEILAEQQKVATFSRHESFGRGTLSPIKSLQGKEVHGFSFHHGPPEKTETSRSGHQSESTQGNDEDGSEVETKQIVHEKINERPISSSSSEENIPLSGANKDQLLKSLSSLAQKDMDSDRDDNDHEIHVPYNTDRLLYEKTKGNSFFGEKRTCHAPNNSLASDLQVEISEVGSPQSTSSNEKSYIFEDYVNKEVTSGGEDMLADSSHPSGVHTNESNTREVDEFSEKDVTDAGFSSINHNLEDPSASQNMLTQDQEEGNNSKPVTIGNEEHTKSEIVKDSESEAESSVKHVDLVEPSNPNNPKSSQDTDENVKNIVGDDTAVHTSKATEDIKNIDSDVKNKELQEAEEKEIKPATTE